jgi:serine/threonine protein kinase
MNYERGLEQLKSALSTSNTEIQMVFATLEARLQSVLSDERLHGPTETTRSERSRIMHELNRLALQHLGESFTDLCLPLKPPPPRRAPAPADKPWRGGAEITVRDRVYVLRDPVDETWAPDRSFVRRRAKAWQPEADRRVWLKQVRVLRATTAATQARDALRHEGRLLARLEHHSDFPRSFDPETSEEAVTIVYAFTPGPTLARAFGPLDKPLDTARAYSLLRSMRPLCGMLAVLHREGLSHRHLTPEDIVLLEGRRDHAVLRDLGLAAQPRTSDVGPALYLAPEQAQATLTVPGPHTDVYQLGAVLYRLLTGRPPTSFLAEIEPPSSWNRSLPSELDDALLRALAEDPADRWPNIRDLRDALAQAANRLKGLLRGNL